MTHGETNLSPEHGSPDLMTAPQGGCPSPPRPRCLGSEDLRDLPVCCYLGFPGGSAGKEFACNVGDLGSFPGLGRSPGVPTPVFWPGEFHELYSSWSLKESDMTERLSLMDLLINGD